MGGVPIRGKLQSYLTKNAGVRVFLKDMAQDLNETEARVQSGMATMLHRDPELANDVEVNVRGQSWTYRPSAKNNSGKRMFEEIGVSRAGEIVLQDTDGKLYKAVEL